MIATTRRRSAASSPAFDHLGKPHGILSPRVRAVGPEHFGIVAVDCAKASSKWMLTDFYGKILIAPTVLDHRRDAFDHALAQISQVTARSRSRRGLGADQGVSQAGWYLAVFPLRE